MHRTFPCAHMMFLGMLRIVFFFPSLTSVPPDSVKGFSHSMTPESCPSFSQADVFPTRRLGRRVSAETVNQLPDELGSSPSLAFVGPRFSLLTGAFLVN